MKLLFCATSLAALLVPSSLRADVARLPAAKRAIFAACPEDVLDKKPCNGKGLAASRTCRDAHAHIHTNEWHHEVWLPYIRSKGGGYVGVGSDQGLTFIAAARSELAWMIDYDPNVVRINRLHRTLVTHSSSPTAFVARWSKAAKKDTLALITKAHGSTTRAKRIARTYRWSRKTMHRYFKRMMRVGKRRTYHWLHSAEAYAHVRKMFGAGRIRIMGGDLLKARALVGIGKAARRLAMPIRVLYLSNAEEYWRYPKQFRKNIAALYFDDKSRVLRTRTSKKGPSIGRYQYVVQAGLDFQKKIATRRISGVWSLLRDKRAVKPTGLFTIGLRRSKTPSKPTARR